MFWYILFILSWVTKPYFFQSPAEFPSLNCSEATCEPIDKRTLHGMTALQDMQNGIAPLSGDFWRIRTENFLRRSQLNVQLVDTKSSLLMFIMKIFHTVVHSEHEI